MGELADQVQETVEHPPESHLNTIIAALVAITATFMALCNVKDGNIVQNMMQAQARTVDQWSYYQAKGTKQHIAENTGEMLAIQRDTAPSLAPATRQMLDAKIAHYQSQAKKYEREKEEIRAKAEGLEKEYDRLNIHDDQFDLAEACLSVSIALFGVTALTKKGWLLFVGLTFCGIGFLMGLAGFLGWSAHSEALAKVLGVLV